jgi:inositol-pentakisphosphate 2-kinase
MPATTPSVTDTYPQHWKYLSEGGATIVFTYVGPSNAMWDNMVLRLRKSRTPAVQQANDDLAGEDHDGKQDEPDDPSIEFQKKCMERLIHKKHLPCLESISVSRQWLEALVALHESERPMERREKDQIDTSRTKAVLATDLVGGEWIAVEIKVGCLSTLPTVGRTFWFS